MAFALAQAQRHINMGKYGDPSIKTSTIGSLKAHARVAGRNRSWLSTFERLQVLVCEGAGQRHTVNRDRTNGKANAWVTSQRRAHQNVRTISFCFTTPELVRLCLGGKRLIYWRMGWLRSGWKKLMGMASDTLFGRLRDNGGRTWDHSLSA